MAFCVKRGIKRSLPEGEEPSKALETEGNKMIKEQVRKQTDVHITLERALRERKEFKKGIDITSLNESGQRSFSELKAIADAIDKMEEQSFPDLNECHVRRKSGLSRDEMEAAMARKPGSLETKLFAWAAGISGDSRGAAVTDKALATAAKALSLGLPMCLAKSLLELRTGRLIQESKESASNPDETTVTGNWDSKQNRNLKQKQNFKKPRVYTVTPPPKCGDFGEGSESKNSCAVFIKSDEAFSVVLGRKTDEEIRSIPAFSNYKRGEPSKDLFVKNLGKSATEDKLGAAVWKAGEEADIDNRSLTMRLLGGRMKGQAFIGTQSVGDARKILELLNGTMICGKPVIVQYGKGKKSSESDLKVIKSD